MRGKLTDDGWKELDVEVLGLDDELTQFLRDHYVETLGMLVMMHGDPPEVESWVPERWQDAVRNAYGRFWAERSPRGRA